MNKTAQKCIYIANLLDEYGFYKEAEIFEDYIKTAQTTQEVPSKKNITPNKSNPVKNPTLLQRFLADDPFEAALKKGVEKGVGSVQKNYGNKAADLAFTGTFVGMDAIDIAQGKDSIKELRKVKSLADFAKKSPDTPKVQSAMSKIATKVPAVAKFLKFAPLVGIIVNLYQSRQTIAKYIDLISQGKFNEIWNDPTERAIFIESFILVIAGVLYVIPIPPLQALAGALYAFASASSLGRSAIDMIVGKGTEEGEAVDKLNQMKTDDYYKAALPETKKAMMVASILLEKNPNLKQLDLLQNPQIRSFKFINRLNKTDQDQFALFSAFVRNIKIELRPQTKITKPTTTTKNIAPDNSSVKKPSQDDKYYVGYGYDAYRRTKDKQIALNALNQKLSQDNVQEIQKQNIINKFNSMFDKK